VYGWTGTRADDVDRAVGRQALHAWRLAFTHPVTGARIEITAPMPDELLQTAGFVESTGDRSRT
jgi:23S rRNA pseudouridine1911/1915/1917 synthase